MHKTTKLKRLTTSAVMLSLALSSLSGCASNPKATETEPEMKISHQFAFTLVIVPIVLAACELNGTPVYDPSLEPDTVTLRDTEAQIYEIIRISPETWAVMSNEERNAVLDHNCVFAQRNPEAAPPGFDISDCQSD